MIKNKKQMFTLIGVFALVLFLGGATYAWFNYRSETSEQELIAGDIYLRLNEGNDEITLTNVFPETVEEARARDDNFITFTVSGKNTSSKTIYYEILLDHGTDKASPKTRYNDTDLKFDLVELDNNGDEVDYLISGGSFDNLNEKRIWVETVEDETTVEVVKRYKLRMWLSEDVIISDSDPNATYNTTEYPNKYATVKLIVNGDFNEKHIDYLYNIMKRQTVMDNINSDYVDNETPGIDFGAVSSDTNGKGVYMRAGTQNDTYPILYYRGAVENNNVIFANKCWQAMRTTDTGGVKLIYNGEIGHIYKDDNYELSAYDNVTRTGNQFEFDTNTNEWKVTLTVPTSGGNSGEANIKFTVAEAGNYTLKFNNPGSGPITAKRGVASLYPASGVNEIALNNLTTSEEINIAYTHYNAPGAQVVMTVALNKGQIDMGIGCDNTGKASQITLNIGGTDTNKFKFSTESGAYNSPAYNGYMYGDVYTYNSGVESGAYYDSTFVWNGTNYTLTDSATTTKSNNAHYSCGETSKTATCATLRYYYYGNYYIILTGGDGVEEALRKMQTNTNDSNAKDKIEDWYEANMTSYTNRIEDTIYCNDRSMNNTNGWNANGGDLNEYLNYGGYLTAPYNGTATPSVSCINKNDSFTWKNSKGNQKLRYPVGMITSDEMILAGGKVGYASSFYLTTGQNYWSLSPDRFSSSGSANEFVVDLSGDVCGFNVSGSYGLRPVVSLRPGTPVVSGDGTVATPYVIES